MSSIYDKQGNRITLRRYAILQNDRDYAVVARTRIGELLVSTVWLGLDHNWSGEGPPLIFETMVFGGKDQPQARWSTEEQALRMHRAIVARIEEGGQPQWEIESG